MITSLKKETWDRVKGQDAYAILRGSHAEQLIYLGHLSGTLQDHVQSRTILDDQDLERYIRNAAVILKNGREMMHNMGESEFELDGHIAKLANRFANKARLLMDCVGILTHRHACSQNRDLAARAIMIAYHADLHLTDMNTQDPERLRLIINRYIQVTDYAIKKNVEDQRYCTDQTQRFISCNMTEDGNFTFQFECRITRRHGTEIGGLPIILPEIPDTYHRGSLDNVHCDIWIEHKMQAPLSVEFEPLEDLRDGDYGAALVTCAVPPQTEKLRLYSCLGGVDAALHSLASINVIDIIAETKQEADLKIKPPSLDQL